MSSNVEERVESDSPREQEKSNKIPNWMIALGVGVAVAGVTAGTVYYVKTQRRKELKNLKYMEPTSQSYTEKFRQYWDFTMKTVGIVKNAVSEFMTPTHSVMVDSTKAASGHTFMMDTDDDIILEEAEL